MHMRYAIPSLAAIQQVFRPHMGHVERLRDLEMPNFHAKPEQKVPVITAFSARSPGLRDLVALQWGLIPLFARGAEAALPNFTARVETVRTSATFGPAWRRGQRCLVPATGFYEWQAQPPDWQATTAYFITVADQAIAFAMAGIWDHYTDGQGVTVRSCNILTMQANALMRDIHNSTFESGKRELIPEQLRRMPAILRPEEHEAWLTGNEQEAWAVLAPYPAHRMRAMAVHPPADGAPVRPLVAGG